MHSKEKTTPLEKRIKDRHTNIKERSYVSQIKIKVPPQVNYVIII